MAISGSGTIDGGATTTVSSTNLVDLRSVTTLAITGVTICNAGHEHLVPVGITNLTISGITIHDNGTLANNSGNYLANTDAIDYAGNNILIKNCNIKCGDDDIVAKPASNACSNILITNCTIGAGHGISVGGGSAQGVNNMVVTNCNFTGTDNGLRLKAQDAAGGDAGGGTAHPVINVTYANIKMTNVSNPIIIDSFYNGGNNFPNSPTNSAFYPTTPVAAGSTTPFWQNITFDNVTATGSSNAGQIYGLNTSPMNLAGVSFNNVSISASSHMNMWYGMGVNVSGLSITVPSGDAYKNASPVPGGYLSNLTIVSTDTVVWDGQADATTWNSLAANWKNGAVTASTYADPANVTFDDTAPAGARAVTLNIAVSPATITLNSTTSNYAVTGSGFVLGPGSLTKNNSGTFTFGVPLQYTGATTLNAGTLQLNAPGNVLTSITGAGNLAIGAAADLTANSMQIGALLLSGSVQLNGTGNTMSAITGSGNLTVASTATLTATTLQIGSFTLAGTATVSSTTSGVISLTSLTIAGASNAWTGHLEINNNPLIVEATSANKSTMLATLQNQISYGTTHAAGITSSSTAADPTHKVTVVIDNSLLGLTQLNGVAVDANSLLVESTYFGDSNLDRKVDVTDLGNLATNYGKSVSSGPVAGDFNNDGKVDVTDLGLLATNYGLGTGGGSFSLVTVPEPASTVLLLGAIPLLLRRVAR
jgi:autotransporter-associated beta strand protein